MRGLKFKVCTVVPYLPYQKCSNSCCITAKGCCYISPFEKEIKGYRSERLKQFRIFEMYKTKVIKANNLVLNGGVFPDDLE